MKFRGPKTGRTYLGSAPSKKRVIRICEAISEMTGRDQTLLDQEIVVAKLNRTLRQWLCAKHKVISRTERFSETFLHDMLGLVRLTQRTRNLPWAIS